MSKKAWVISVNMGYGHRRAAYALGSLAQDLIQANDYLGIPEKDQRIWKSTRVAYEIISKLRKIPLIGEFVFFLFDKFQEIKKFYPKRNLSKPNLQLKQTMSLIEKGWGKDLITKLKEKPLPIITTFFTTAFMAENFGYSKKIFCVICDADISRAWAPLKPSTSKIQYLAPNQRVVERLKMYGVKEKNIFLTGFPLPMENIGTKRMEALKKDLAKRIVNLDPKGRFNSYYEALVKKHLGRLPKKDHPLTIMFAIGGAGAQSEIGVKIAKSLAKKINKKEVKLILVAGMKEGVKEDLLKKTKGIAVDVLFERDFKSYFRSFNLALRKTDILWTKPSELSFYTALGLPIIIAPPLGSQEKFNRRWLLDLGSGINQRNPVYTDQWLFDLLDKGQLAEAAFEGFLEAEKLGTLNIKKVVVR